MASRGFGQADMTTTSINLSGGYYGGGYYNPVAVTDPYTGNTVEQLWNGSSNVGNNNLLVNPSQIGITSNVQGNGGLVPTVANSSLWIWILGGLTLVLALKK